MNAEYSWITKGDLVISSDNIIGYFDSWKDVRGLCWHSECANNIGDRIAPGTFRAIGLRRPTNAERIKFEDLLRKKITSEGNRRRI